MALSLNIRSTGRGGRGSGINPDPRFGGFVRTADSDGADGDDIRNPRTTVTEEKAKRIITRNTSPDIGFDRSINAYRGCEHGCVYCFARPTHAFLDLSPGLDFETKLFVKPDAAALLKAELAARGYTARSIALGTNTDPYQPIERERCITRAIIEVLSATDHPVGIVTKSDLVLRDLDLLGPMARKGLAKVGLSVTTLDGRLARLMEPRAPTPAKRLAAVEALSAAGVPVTGLVAPIVPAINDHEIEDVVAALAAAGARHVNFVLLRLPHEVKDIFRDWLARHFPDRARRVMAVMQAMRGGKDYDARWGVRQRGEGPFAVAVDQRMRLAAKRHGLTIGTVRLDTTQFRKPEPARAQLDLFG
ncbi:MAG: PA0069 family radical SAM protein [Pseudomonadota bacterium]